MNRILAQDELDDLIKAVSTDPPLSQDGDSRVSSLASEMSFPAHPEPTAPPSHAKHVHQPQTKLFDFREATMLSSAQREMLAGICERIAQGSTRALGLFLQRPLAVRSEPASACPATQLLDSFPGSACCIAFSTAPDRGQGLIIVEPALAFLLVDLFLGGRGDEAHPDRELSEIDLKISDKAIRAIEAQVREVFEEPLHVKTKRECIESRPRQLLAQFVGQHVVCCRFELLLGEFQGYFTVAIPFGAVQFETRSTRHVHRSAAELSHRIGEPMKKLPLKISVELDPFEMKLIDLLELQVGDLVRTGAAISSPLRISIAGKPKMSGELIVENGKREIRIL